MTTARAGTKREALGLLDAAGVGLVELNYESGWQDASEPSHLGKKVGGRVEYRGHESVVVMSPAALVAGLKRPKLTFRQRNLYCQFALTELTASELAALETKAMKLGDYILAGHLLRKAEIVWGE